MMKQAASGSGWRLLFLAVWMVFAASSSSAQTSTGKDGAAVEAPSTAAFEVATIKPAAPSPDGHTHVNYPVGGGFSASNITLLALMGWAYEMPEKQILDGPSWITSDRFDIQAKSDLETDGQLRGLSSEQSREFKRRMVKALLAERCGLKLHQETRILPAYDLPLAKGGTKLQPSASNGKSTSVGRTYFNGQGVTAAMIAEQLSHISGRIVVDKTNLPDRYDLKLQWTPDDAPVGDDSAPSLFSAIQEQLGLKLESAREPVPVTVIDHIERPSAN